MSECREVPLGDVLTLQEGFDITKNAQRPGPVPVASSSGIASFHDEARAEGPGVVIGRRGSLGTTFFMKGPYWPHDTTLWVKDFKGNDPYFCYLPLKTLRLSELDAGSANPTLNRNHAHLLPVRIVDVVTQRRVAVILCAFDELISINKRRIKLLEDIARSLYREWFVRFRFPGHDDVEFVDSELGPIPEGWEVRRLADLVKVVSDGVDPGELSSADVYIRGPRALASSSHHVAKLGVTSIGDEPQVALCSRRHAVRQDPAVLSQGGLGAGRRRHILGHNRDSPVGPSNTTALVNAICSSDAVVSEVAAASSGTKMPRADPQVLLAAPSVFRRRSNASCVRRGGEALARVRRRACVAQRVTRRYPRPAPPTSRHRAPRHLRDRCRRPPTSRAHVTPRDFSERGLVEEPTLALLGRLGYETANGYTELFGADHAFASGLGRDDQSQVVLHHRLRPKLASLNPDVPAAGIGAAIDELMLDRSGMDPTRANQAVWKLLRDGAKVTVADDRGGRRRRPSASLTGSCRPTTNSSRCSSSGSSVRCTPGAATSPASSTASRLCCSS